MSVSYCFIGGMVFPSQIVEVSHKSKCGLQNAPNAYQFAFINGLAANLGSIDLINLPFLGSWPLNYKSFHSPKSESFNYETNSGNIVSCKNCSFLNITYFKNYFRESKCYSAMKNFCEEHKTDERIFFIIYTLHQSFLRALNKIKKEYENVRSIVIVTDLPEYKNDTMPSWKQWLYNYDTHISKNEYNSADGYILLSEYMADKVIFNKQPYITIEGLFTPDAYDNGPICNRNIVNEKIIFYSGTLARRYNIMNLVHAFTQIPDQSIRLQICGNGSCKDEILQIAEKDHRIQFLGELSREEVLKLQRNATLLVNPRTDEGEFTKYSFPSKTMEYLASGTPTLLYKLPGIPEEYYNYCFTLEGNRINDLKNKIEEILALPKSTLRTLGNNARQFILTQKNSSVQVRKILGLFQKIN